MLMRTVHVWLSPLFVGLFAVTLGPAIAQDSLSPSNAVCGLVNFAFCDQSVARPAAPSSNLAPGVVPPPPDGKPETAPAKSRKTASATTAKPKGKGNCATGWFTTASGERFQFIGVAKRRLEGDPRYVILHNNLRMEDNEGSGYREAIQQFKALCPSRVPFPDN